MDVLKSAFRHGVASEDIQYVVRDALAVEEIGDDPVRFLILGVDQAGRFLELIVLDRPQGPALIHAMQMRKRYRALLAALLLADAALPKGW